MICTASKYGAKILVFSPHQQRLTDMTPVLRKAIEDHNMGAQTFNWCCLGLTDEHGVNIEAHAHALSNTHLREETGAEYFVCRQDVGCCSRRAAQPLPFGACGFVA